MSDNGRELTINQAYSRVKRCMDKRRPVFLWGASGIGKSDFVRDIAKEMNGVSIDCRLHIMQPTDIMGIPYYNKEDNVMAWAPPIMLPSAKFAAQHETVILFLDEMNTAPPATQASAYQLILDRKVGQYVLPDNVLIIAAGNRETDRGVTYKMPAPLANRFVHIEIRSDFDSWFDWAIKNDIHADVIGFLSHAKSKLHDFDPKSTEKAFPTPRTWAFVSELVGDGLADTELTDLVCGTVGQGAALSFMAHRRMAKDLPNPSDILDGKVKELHTKETSALYSLIIGMAYELKDRSVNGKDKYPEKVWNQNVANYFRFTMDNMGVEYNVMGAKILMQNYKLNINPKNISCMDEFFKRYSKFVLAASSTR